MKYKPIIVVLTAVMVIFLAACGKTPAHNKSELSVSTDTQVESSNEVDAPTDESPVADADNSVNDEAWKNCRPVDKAQRDNDHAGNDQLHRMPHERSKNAVLRQSLSCT